VAEEANIELRKEIPEDLPRVLGDWSRISEVFDNLLDNAIKFSPDGGAVTVRVKEEKDWLRAEVADVGIGIPDEKLSRIFDRFYQADGSSRRRFGGAGLGLAIVKRIIEANGGEVGVMSEIGKGSVFYFVIPKRREVTS
jgi:signal transduction histidine kinase